MANSTEAWIAQHVGAMPEWLTKALDNSWAEAPGAMQEPVFSVPVTLEMIDLALEANQETYDKCMEVWEDIKSDPVAGAVRVVEWDAINMHWQKLRRVLFALARTNRLQEKARKETENVWA